MVWRFVLLYICLCCEYVSSEWKKPTVLIGILARNQAHTLPYFLTSLENLDYPKDRISLWIRSDHNSDKTIEILDKWIAAVKDDYHIISTDFVEGEKSYLDERGPAHWTKERFNHVIDLRESALNFARYLWADYFLQKMDEENNGQIANLLVCPRDCQDHTNVLQVFRRLKPPNCPFIATRVWSRDTRKQKCCMWGVLYQSIDGTPYLQGTQAQELRKQLNAWRPVGGEIVDYEFYQNQATNERGWVFTWRRLACTHQPHFPKQYNTRTEELKIYM